MRPYIAETEASKLKRPDFPHGEDSWSPQPFRMASSGSPAKDIRRETFISSKKEAFDESNVNKENISSPRRDTFIVPKGLAISDETITIRRETFVSVNPRPMLTSTPRIGGGGQGSQVWHSRLWSFQGRDTKLERFLAKNQLYSNEITKF